MYYKSYFTKGIKIKNLGEILAVVFLSGYLFSMQNIVTKFASFLFELLCALFLLKACSYKLRKTPYIIVFLSLEIMILFFTMIDKELSYSYLCFVFAETILVLYVVTNIKEDSVKLIDVFQKAFTILFILDVTTVIWCFVTNNHTNASFGLAGHKNYHSFLFILSIGFALVNSKLKTGKAVNIWSCSAAALSVLCEVLLDSASGIVAVTMFLFLCILADYTRIKFLNLYMILVFLLMINYIFIFSLPGKWMTSIVAMLGKDIGLTGRANMWKLAKELIDVHPFYGYGFAKRVAIRNSPESELILNNCHNFFLNLVLSGGIFYFAAVVTLLFRIAHNLKRCHNAVADLLVCIIGCYLLVGVSEVIVNVNTLLFPLLTFGYFADEISGNKTVMKSKIKE